MNGHLQCAQILLKNSADEDAQDEDGFTPLMRACENGHDELLACLRRKNAHEVTTNNDGYNALHLATQNGHENLVKKLIKKESIDINATTNDEQTALLIACESEEGACAKLLLKAGADASIKNDSDETVLHKMVVIDNSDMVRILLDYEDVDVDMVDGEQNTPLCIAAANDYPNILEMLIDYEASLNVQNENNRTALMIACYHDHASCVELLLKAGADPSFTDDNEETALDHAISYGYNSSIKHFIDYDVAINAENASDYVQKAHLEREPNTARMIGEHFEIPYDYDGSLSDVDQASNAESEEEHVEENSEPCKYQILAQRFLDKMDLPDVYLNKAFNVCFCEDCHHKRSDVLYFMRGEPPKQYGLPIGWVKFGLKVPPKASGLKVFNCWHHAFHGTHVGSVGKILETGDLLMPGDFTPEGAQLRPPSGHFDDKSKNKTMKPPKDHNIYKIFLSPSIRYSGVNTYAPKFKFEDEVEGKNFSARAAFQVCIKPDSYNVGKSTIPGKDFDPKFSDDLLEWSTKRRGVTILVGLLIKIEGYIEDIDTEGLRKVAQVEAVESQTPVVSKEKPKTLKAKAAALANTDKDGQNPSKTNTSPTKEPHKTCTCTLL